MASPKRGDVRIAGTRTTPQALAPRATGTCSAACPMRQRWATVVLESLPGIEMSSGSERGFETDSVGPLSAAAVSSVKSFVDTSKSKCS